MKNIYLLIALMPMSTLACVSNEFSDKKSNFTNSFGLVSFSGGQFSQDHDDEAHHANPETSHPGGVNILLDHHHDESHNKIKQMINNSDVKNTSHHDENSDHNDHDNHTPDNHENSLSGDKH